MQVASFFAGGGGACSGLEQAGLDVAWGNENNQVAGNVWAANHPDAYLDRQDFLDLDSDDFPSADVWWISPPCQQFSGANKKRTGGTKDESTDLARRIGARISLFEPKFVVIENVPSYRSSHSWQIIKKLLDSRYRTTTRVVNCADYGVAQTRGRFIAIAELFGKRDLFPEAICSKASSGQPDCLDPWVSWYDAVYDLLPGLEHTYLTDRQRLDLLRANYVPLKHSTPLLVQRLGYNMDTGNQIKNVYQPSWTITASQGSDNRPRKDGYPSFRAPATVLMPNQDPLRVDWQCLARWQGFPDSHDWAGVCHALRCKAIGNAVPPPLAKAIGLAISKTILPKS